jgi:MFS family permease
LSCDRQVIGWGTVGLLAVVGGQVAADLGMDISAVFAGNSIFYVAMGLWAPILAKAFTRFGARRVMIAGTIVGAPGFVLLSLSHGPMLFSRRGSSSARPAAPRWPPPPTSCSTRSRAGMQGARSAR